MKGLTPEEANLVYNLEVLGMPVRAAAQLAGCSPTRAALPHIMRSRELLRAEIRGDTSTTKEDCIFGIKEAIDLARVIGEPATMLAGWRDLVKMHGYDAPKKVEIDVKGSVDVVQKRVREFTDAQLIELLDAEKIIDAEFYEVRK